jgi:hypothetical protein
VSRAVKGKLLADQGESRAFVNISRDLLGVFKRLLNLLDFFAAIHDANAQFACCGAAQLAFSKQYPQ